MAPAALGLLGGWWGTLQGRPEDSRASDLPNVLIRTHCLAACGASTSKITEILEHIAELASGIKGLRCEDVWIASPHVCLQSGVLHIGLCKHPPEDNVFQNALLRGARAALTLSCPSPAGYPVEGALDLAHHQRHKLVRPVASTPAVPALPAFWCKLEVWVLPLQ